MSKRRMPLWAFALVLVAQGAPAVGKERFLVRDANPTALILISSSPRAEEKLAAEELRTYIRKISGATLSITSTIRPRMGTTVRIGVFQRAPVAAWRGKRPAHDGYVLETRGDTLWIVGGDPRGALYGVYALLDDTLGVRWFMPGELGEDVPQQRTIPLPRLKQRTAPAFGAVGGLIWAGGPGAEDWERRIRGRVGPPSAFFGHNWENIIPTTPENRAAHPDWFALHGGQRINQLCTTNPDVIRISVEKARAFFDQNPQALVFSLSPNDGNAFCECERCRALDRQYGVTDGSPSDRFVHYANQVLAELRKTHPGKQVGILAYVSHTHPPVTARPDPQYATLICHTPWEFCHVHSLDDSACPRNRRFVKIVRGWRHVCRHVGVYDYYGHFYVFTPWPILHDIRRDLPLLRRLGVDRFMSETQQHWANQGLNFYVAAKLAWDPKMDVDRLLKEYYRRFYGKAAPPMRRYWERWELAMIETAKVGDGGYHWLRMFTPELVAECGRLLSEAEGRAAEDSEKMRRRVALARQGYRFTEAWARMRRHAELKEWAAAVAAGEEAIRRIEESEGTEPQAFWIWLAKSQTESMLKPCRDGLATTP